MIYCTFCIILRICTRSKALLFFKATVKAQSGIREYCYRKECKGLIKSNQQQQFVNIHVSKLKSYSNKTISEIKLVNNSLHFRMTSTQNRMVSALGSLIRDADCKDAINWLGAISLKYQEYKRVVDFLKFGTGHLAYLSVFIFWGTNFRLISFDRLTP